MQSLLQQSLELVPELQNRGFPPIQRGLQEIVEQSKSLAKKCSRTGHVNKNKAHYFLAAKGYDAERFTRDINAMDIKATFESLEPLSETDIEGQLQHNFDLVILTAIEESKQLAIQSFQDQLSTHMEMDWEERKQELLQSFGQHSGLWTGSLLRHDSNTLHPAASGAYPPTNAGAANANSGLSKAGLDYAYALARFHSQPADCALVSEFTRVAASPDDPVSNQPDLVDSWNILQAMVANAAGPDLPPGSSLPARYFHSEYRTNAPALRARLVQGGLRFLEDQYANLIYARISQPEHARTAQLGGVPGLVNGIKAFLKVQYDRPKREWPAEFEDFVDGYPLWPLLYYCMRCGDFGAGLELAQSVPDIAGEIAGYLRLYIGSERCSLPEKKWRELLLSFKERVQHSKDLYKVAVYNILGRCETSKSYTQVFSARQDFLWLKLRMLCEGLQPSPQFRAHVLPLAQLQDILHKYGPAHFDPLGTNPWAYFQVLLLTLQFERAVHYLASNGQLRDAVHFALALSHCGLLIENTDPAAMLLIDQPPCPLLNLSLLLRHYTIPFIHTHPREAVHYCLALTNEEIRNRFLRDLVIETKEFDTLLGSIHSDGTQRPGYLARFVTESDHISITRLCAEYCESHGLYEEAIKLFDLAKDCTQVVHILIHQISQVLTASTPERTRLLELARLIATRYSAQNLFASLTDPMLEGTFVQLVQLAHFFDLFAAERWEEALSTVASLHVLPLTGPSIDASVETFGSLDDAVRRNIPELLLATMSCLYKLYTALKVRTRGAPSSAPNHQMMDELRLRAQGLVTFAGSIQYPLPGDTNAQLIRMSVLMN
eukprot:gnl/Trimastix_PCT/2080.p1 GENE.gnl/Trimastix_PCT/2080~~gnl/Trimastix_PCT/2080.p1  ORF type:complete len:831 (+),score=254.74 gnl/Trimastix_PCT/2080:24-2516(+)